MKRHLSTKGPRTFDAVIIGSGVIGTSIARSLSKLGYRTVNVDKCAKPGYGSTSYSSGIIRTFYSTDEMTKFSYEGYHRWQNWEEFLGVKDPDGMGMFLKSPESASFCEKVKLHHKNNGIPVLDYDVNELKRRLPLLNTASFGPPKLSEDPDFGEENGEVDGALFFTHQAFCSDPQRATGNLAYAAELAGASFLYNAQVMEVLRGAGDRIAGVKLSDGSVLESPILVNCAGPHSATVNRTVFKDGEDDMKVKPRAFRTEVASVPRPAGFDNGHGGEHLAAGDLNLGFYFRTEVGNKLLVGGSEPACDVPHFDWLNNPDELPDEMQTSDSGHSQYTEYTSRAGLRIPSLGLPSTAAGITALYDVTPDWVPIYDSTAVQGYYMACGTSGNQFKCAPVVGDLMAGLIDKNETSRDQDTNPYVAKLTETDTALETVGFSRLRKSPETSASVFA